MTPLEKITPETLALWKRLADEAEPGPYGVERVDHEDGITYEVSSPNKHFHVVFRESEHIDEGINCKKQADLYAAARTAVPALIEEVERLKGDLEFTNDVVKERESWAAMRLKTCKKLEEENDRLRKQNEKFREQRDCYGGNLGADGCWFSSDPDKDNAELDAIK